LPLALPRYFIYYKVSPEQLPGVLVQVVAAQAALRAQHPGLKTELMQRQAQPSGAEDASSASTPMLTLMEIYRPAQAEQVLALQTTLAQLEQGLAGQLGSPRHVECFVSCA
jgi:hypothetical protein